MRFPLESNVADFPVHEPTCAFRKSEDTSFGGHSVSGLIVFALPSPFEKAKTTITPLPFLPRLLLRVDAFVALLLLSSVLSNDQTCECAAVKEDIVYSLCRAMIFDSSVSFPCECYHELYLQIVDGNERFTLARSSHFSPRGRKCGENLKHTKAKRKKYLAR